MVGGSLSASVISITVVKYPRVCFVSHAEQRLRVLICIVSRVQAPALIHNKPIKFKFADCLRDIQEIRIEIRDRDSLVIEH